MKKFFLEICGMDGSGKSSNIPFIIETIETDLGRAGDVVVTREPGGTQLSEKIRELILNDSMTIQTEVLLFAAARNEHVETLIVPSLNSGKIVVTDRYDSCSIAYQGWARGYCTETIENLINLSTGGLKPDLTLYFDLPAEIAYERVSRARECKDRFEKMDVDFFKRVRNGYLDLCQKEPGRYQIIDSSQTIEDVRRDVKSILLSHKSDFN